MNWNNVSRISPGAGLSSIQGGTSKVQDQVAGAVSQALWSTSIDAKTLEQMGRMREGFLREHAYFQRHGTHSGDKWIAYYVPNDGADVLDVTVFYHFHQSIEACIGYLRANPQIRQIRFWKPSNRLYRYWVEITAADSIEQVLQRIEVLEERQESEERREVHDILKPNVEPIITEIERLLRSGDSAALREVYGLFAKFSDFRDYYDKYAHIDSAEPRRIRKELSKLPENAWLDPNTLGRHLEYFLDEGEVDRLVEAFRQAGFDREKIESTPIERRLFLEVAFLQVLRSIQDHRRPPENVGIYEFGASQP